MFKNIIAGLFGSSNSREIEKLGRTVARINNLERQYSTREDQYLRDQSNIFRTMLKNGKTLDDILPDVFAVVREAGIRTLGLRAFDVQLMGAIVLHQGKIAEMKTGEGKTFVAVFSAYLNALEEKGVHIVTVNDYLAKRDSEWMGRVYSFLGMKVGCVLQNMTDERRREAYGCDITYGTNSELGFDYLRDNMKVEKEELSQRDFNFAIVDEVDSILIDEARTPLIISGSTDDNSELYEKIDSVIRNTDDSLCSVDEKERTVVLTEEGIEYIEQKLGEKELITAGDNLYDVKYVDIVHHVNQALKAHKLFKNDVDYMVKNGQVLLVDEFTGRIMDGRRFSDGLHQALEAKEMVKIRNENQTLASITYQNYFRMYPKLAGMTGTAATEAEEFEYIYNLKTIEIPTNVPANRNDEDDVIYKTEKAKYAAIVEQIKDCHQRKQPVLAGTVNIERSEKLSKLLKESAIPHNVLNAKYHEKEAFIIAQAGKPSMVTIATNMAGRGTDIKLGGSVDFEIRDIENDSTLTVEQKKSMIEKIMEKNALDKQIVIDAGGLYILGTERHESRRIDNQLRGRSGRQGDTGVSKFFLSLEDDLMRIFGSDKLAGMLTKLGLEDDEAIFHPWISKSLEKAQKKVENMHYETRKSVLKYDDVVNTQRKVIFEQRREIMFSNSVSDEIDYMIETKNNELVNLFTPRGAEVADYDLVGLRNEVFRIYGINFDFNEYLEGNPKVNPDNILKILQQETKKLFDSKMESYGDDVVRIMRKHVLLLTVDRLWKDHLYALDKIRQSIGLRAYGQKDPLLEFKKEAYDLFEILMRSIDEESISVLAKTKITMDSTLNGQVKFRNANIENDPDNVEQDFVDAMNLTQRQTTGLTRKAGKQETIITRGNKRLDPNNPDTWGRVGRNDSCPCGSGKKYKQCCGKSK
ncbi:MAG: preprotein translocase subunit SecA [Rickettsiales bacterium]|jgi:preprotein translocase subunit SecA|nr:preprotein translocase subunit SecA [Rickettsiales bacterium]